jgi:hypothetical protein
VYGRLEISESREGGHEGPAAGVTRLMDSVDGLRVLEDEEFEVDGRGCFSPLPLILNPSWCR